MGLFKIHSYLYFNTCIRTDIHDMQIKGPEYHAAVLIVKAGLRPEVITFGWPSGQFIPSSSLGAIVPLSFVACAGKVYNTPPSQVCSSPQDGSLRCPQLQACCSRAHIHAAGKTP